MDLNGIDFYLIFDLFLLLLIGMGPKIALVPFLELTSDLDRATRKKVASQMVRTGVTVALILVVLGAFLMKLLHFSEGALDGAFWGMLFGLIFFIPLFGMAFGAAMGALSDKFSDYGIDDDFIKSVQGKVTEGTSALFLMTSDAVMDKVADAFKGIEFEIMTTNLSNEEEAELCEAFGA